ncbi:MAG: prephenate dehydrogenase/arogenate dehydrogenase family protein [Candidatus Saccharimonadales bacterium]
MNKKYTIGIVGYGDFSKVMIQWLSPFADIVVSTRQASDDVLPDGARFGDVAEVLSQPIIIPSIPAQFLQQFFTDHRELINPVALVIDVCSVKVRPLQVLQSVLPQTCQIIGTHPMFGPASITRNGGIASLPCALCPVRATQLVVDELRHLLTDELQLRVIDTTPEQHDREMAYVQGLSHYIGRVMDEMQIPDSQLQTAAYEDLLDMKRIQGGDSWDLFRSIVHENPYAPQVNADFIAACKRVSHKVGLTDDK